MSWTRVYPNAGMGLEEQWIFRPDAAPLCSLRRDKDETWQTRLLQPPDGIGCAVLWLSAALTLEEAKRESEAELTRMGWQWTGCLVIRKESRPWRRRI